MIKDKLAKLINVKSIITILLTLVFCYMSVMGVITAELFMSVFTVMIGFYFGNQTNKVKTE